MKIAVCEDNNADMSSLKQAIEKYFSSRLLEDKTVVYYCFTNGEEFLAASGGFKYDLVFLDIYMSYLDGMEVARRIRLENRIVPIVFVTNSDDYVFDGYDVGASGYLMKPIDPERFESIMDRVFSYYVKKGAVRFLCRRKVVELDMEDIVFIESMGRLLMIHCCDGTVYKVNEKLDDFESRMGNPGFLRCHKSYLVNMSCINGVVGTRFLLSNGVRVSIRQRDFGYIIRCYERFMSDSMP